MTLTYNVRVAHAEKLLWDELRNQNVVDETINRLLELLSTWKGRSPFLVECWHHSVKPDWDSRIIALDTEENPVENTPGIQDSFRIGTLAQHLRVVRWRTAEIVLTLSNLHHTQWDANGRKHIEEIAERNEEELSAQYRWIFSGAIDGLIPFPERLKFVTQSEATRKIRNRISALRDFYDGSREKARALYEKLGIILFHAKSIDGIEVLYLSTRESRSGKSEKLTWGIPLLTRLEGEKDWKTECWPTVSWFHYVMWSRLWTNNPSSSILTIDDFTDPTIWLKSMRWVHINNALFSTRVQNIVVLTDLEGTRKNIEIRGDKETEDDFETVIAREWGHLASQGFSEIYVNKEQEPFMVGGGGKEIPGCNLGICAIL